MDKDEPRFYRMIIIPGPVEFDNFARLYTNLRINAERPSQRDYNNAMERRATIRAKCTTRSGRNGNEIHRYLGISRYDTASRARGIKILYNGKSSKVLGIVKDIFPEAEMSPIDV